MKLAKAAWLLPLSLVPPPAAAKIVHLNSCVATIGSFCPVETVGITVAVGVVLFGAGLPLRWGLRQHMMKRLKGDADYQPSGATLFLYRNAGRLSILGIGLAIAAFVMAAG